MISLCSRPTKTTAPPGQAGHPFEAATSHGIVFPRVQGSILPSTCQPHADGTSSLSAMPRSPTPQLPSTIEGVNIDAWTQKTVSFIPLPTSTFSAALAERPLSSLRSDSTTLAIPLDRAPEKSLTEQRREAKILKDRAAGRNENEDADATAPPPGLLRRTSTPHRRDSQKRREALLKGKDGSRRRQKWENDHLLGNPALQPPEPHDWAPHPTHRARNVPYIVAPLWEAGYAVAARERAEKVRLQRPQLAQVPRELRERLKRARGAKRLLRDLEEQVRAFVKQWEERALGGEGYVDVGDSDESEEEVVFVGRRGGGERGGHRRGDSEEGRRERLVFDSLVEDQGAGFGRWLVHSIASYYNLRTWSVTTGDPARREAYVGIPDAKASSAVEMSMALPRPLWVLV